MESGVDHVMLLIKNNAPKFLSKYLNHNHYNMNNKNNFMQKKLNIRFYCICYIVAVFQIINYYLILDLNDHYNLL